MATVRNLVSLLLLVLAVETAADCDCPDGDNGGQGDICLKLIEAEDCPSSLPHSTRCTPDQVDVGELCEADEDEYGTDGDADNCGMYDVYERIPCAASSGAASSRAASSNGQCTGSPWGCGSYSLNIHYCYTAGGTATGCDWQWDPDSFGTDGVCYGSHFPCSYYSADRVGCALVGCTYYD